MKMSKKIKDRYRVFLRSTSNVNTTTGQMQIALPPKVRKRMDWKINENLKIDIIKVGIEHAIHITKDEGAINE